VAPTYLGGAWSFFCKATNLGVLSPQLQSSVNGWSAKSEAAGPGAPAPQTRLLIWNPR
jgi:hypothetical protein